MGGGGLLRAAALVLAAGLSVGCGDDDGSAAGDAADAASGDAGSGQTGRLELRFQVGGAVASSRNLVDPLIGPVYGAMYRQEDVALTGPKEGTSSLVGVDVERLDLTAGGVSEVLWTGDVPAGPVVFLGYFDVDDSAARLGEDPPNPENGDPVPLADSNQLTIEAGVTTQYTATFELVYAFD